jgi:hypothetical protein
MATFYRFQNEKPRRGEEVHCFTNIHALRSFANLMQSQDPDFHRMKYWEVEGLYLRDDDGDVVVVVGTAKQIKLYNIGSSQDVVAD